MKLSIVDMYASGSVSTALVGVAAAIQKQIDQDFFPTWGLRADLRVESFSVDAAPLHHADAIVYVSSEAQAPPNHVSKALAFHFTNLAGIPSGFVFPDALTANQSWSQALSHEILELLVDPDVNLLVPGPHPKGTGVVLRPYEVCDPVQSVSYEIDGVTVGDFVTPQYFTRANRRPSGRELTHFARTPQLLPFATIPGGYFTYFDIEQRTWRVHTGNDATAQSWLASRQKTGFAPRQFRRIRSDYDSMVQGLIALGPAACAGLNPDGGANGVLGWPGGGWP